VDTLKSDTIRRMIASIALNEIKYCIAETFPPSSELVNSCRNLSVHGRIQVDDEHSAPLLPARTPRPSRNSWPYSSINELRAKAIIIYICISNKQKSNIAESSQLATLQRHPFRNFTLTGSPLPHSLTSVLCAQLLALFAPSPTTAGCAEQSCPAPRHRSLIHRELRPRLRILSKCPSE
jgi:hypothetical protein